MIDFDYKEFENLIKEVEKVALPSQIEDTNKKILKKCSEIAKEAAEKNMHSSDDPSKSGRKGSRTGEHAKDNIPISSIKKRKNFENYVVVGWEKSDNSPYFYVKFEEWGTTQRPPHPIFSLIYEEFGGEWNKIAYLEFDKLLKKLERV